MLSICFAALYTLGPSVPVSTSDAGYLDGPRHVSIILDTVLVKYVDICLHQTNIPLEVYCRRHRLIPGKSVYPLHSAEFQ